MQYSRYSLNAQVVSHTMRPQKLPIYTTNPRYTLYMSWTYRPRLAVYDKSAYWSLAFTVSRQEDVSDRMDGDAAY